MNWRCWFRHAWQTHQVGVMAHDGNFGFVLAWKQCPRCAASKLVHVLV